MSRIADLRPTGAVKGILPYALVTVVTTQWFGSEPLELTRKTTAGEIANELLYSHDDPGANRRAGAPEPTAKDQR